MGIGELFDRGFISTRRDAARDFQVEVGRKLAATAQQAGARNGRQAAEQLGRDVFKPSSELAGMTRQAARAMPTADMAAANPMKAIDAAEKPLEPALLAKVPGLVTADPAAAEQQLEGLYGGIARSATPNVSTSVDNQLGQAMMARAAQQTPEVNTKYPQLVGYVQGVIDRLTKAAGVEPYSLHLLETKDVNAFNAGGPSMAVLTGILPFMHNEAELAGVLGHEMTHGINRHVIQGAVRREAAQDASALVMQQHPMTAADATVVKALLGKLTPDQLKNPEAVLGALRGKVRPEVMANLQFQENTDLAMLALQRGNESEADAGAARLLSKAGYDPNALITAFQRLPQAPGDVRLMDHPLNSQRIADLQQQIAAEKLAVGPMETNAAAYQQAIAVLKDAPALA